MAGGDVNELPLDQRVLPTTPEELETVPLPPPHPLPAPPNGERHPLVMIVEDDGWCSFCRQTQVRVVQVGHLDGAIRYGVCEGCVAMMSREIALCLQQT